jgi:hypothetical protein
MSDGDVHIEGTGGRQARGHGVRQGDGQGDGQRDGQRDGQGDDAGEIRKELSRTEIRRLFTRLDEELARRGQSVAVYVVGGANIALTVDGSRTTTDIDAVVKAGYEHLVRAARVVAGTESGLPDDWINADFTGGDNPTGGLFWRWFDNRDQDIPEISFTGETLTVELASPEMMLALKTLANRDQDLVDTFTLMRITGITTPEAIGRNLARFTGPRLFRIQGTDAVYPRVDPRFRHIFDNAPADLRAASDDEPGTARHGWTRWLWRRRRS